MGNRFVFIFAAIVAVFLGLLFINKDGADVAEEAVEPTSHIAGGGAENSVSLIEYADFECPACAAYYPILNELKDKYGDQLAVQFRHYPLVSIHPNAMAAHRAAEAAGQQGKFFEMHDLLFENQTAWSTRSTSNPTGVIESYAASIGLDMEQYRQEVSSIRIKNIIDADIAEGGRLNATSTPTFVLNGTKLDENPRDLEGFSALIDEALGITSTE